MKTKLAMKETEIVTISKAKFDKMSKAKQRMVVAQDVIDRVKLGQIVSKAGDFLNVKTDFDSGSQVCEQLKSPEFKCEACAKGGLFMSFIGITNNLKFSEIAYSTTLGDKDMKKLQKIFSAEQLALIEVAFEGQNYPSNDAVSLDRKSINRTHEFYYKFIGDAGYFDSRFGVNSEKRLIGIMKNIIKNKGTFKP